MSEGTPGFQPPSELLRPTLAERLVGRLPLPYGVAVLLLGVLAGSPAFYLAQFLDRGSPGLPTSLAETATDTVYVIIPIYAFVAVRYLRRRIVAAGPELRALAAGGDEAYRAAFRQVGRTGPPLVLTLVFIVIGAYALGNLGGIASAVFEVVSLIITNLAAVSLIWAYASCIWGLYSLGNSSLRLRPYYEDSLLGARVMGSLSLAFLSAYFGEVFLAGLLFFSNPVFLGLLLAVSLTGIVLFFLPLVSIHRRMVEARDKHRAEVRADLSALLQSLHGSREESESATLTDVRRILAHDILDRKVSAVHTWPFDTGVFSQFTVIIVSVIAILLSRIVQIALRL